MIGQPSRDSISDWVVSLLTRPEIKSHDLGDQQQQSAADKLIRGEFKSDFGQDGIITLQLCVVTRTGVKSLKRWRFI